MGKRLKVLMSAYACEPGKGSEPEVGWQWALQMARFHDVTVLTRANNQMSIARGLATLPAAVPRPKFLFHDAGPWLLKLKKVFHATQLYYTFWQRAAHALIAARLAREPFDLLHHVTFAGFRFPTAVWHQGVPCIWGPVGGAESIPAALLPWRHPRSLAGELLRNLSNGFQFSPLSPLRRRARASTVLLASTHEMQRAFSRRGFPAHLMPTIGLPTRNLPARPPDPRPEDAPLRLLYVGNLIALKGLDLALEALRASQANATFTLIGEGRLGPSLQRLTQKLGLAARVSFAGRRPQPEVLRAYSQFDLLLFPSLHDTGGYAVIEAMASGLPVVCLDSGGPAIAVRENCGIKVPLGSRREVVAGLGRAVHLYDENRALLAEHGRQARERVLEFYEWDRKGEEMNRVYQEAVGAVRQAA